MSKTVEELAKEYVIEKYFKYLKREEDDNYDLLIQDFIADYQAAMNSPEKPDTCEHILDMEKMVDVNPSSGWISVKDRLPEDWDDLSIMLVWRNIEHDYDTVRWRYQQGWDCVIQDKSTITHWMPLPKPPKEEG